MHPTDQTSIAGPCTGFSKGSWGTKTAETHIVRKAQHDLWCTVPPCRNILRHEALVRCAPALVRATTWLVPTRETKVADLQLAVGVHEQVARLEITVQHIRGVDVLEAAEGLVDEGLEVCVRKGLLRADLRWGRA